MSPAVPRVGTVDVASGRPSSVRPAVGILVATARGAVGLTIAFLAAAATQGASVLEITSVVPARCLLQRSWK